MKEERINVLGVQLSNLSKEEIRLKINQFLKSEGNKFITTINPEIILKAKDDPNYKKQLNTADLSICDGYGIYLISSFFNKKIKCRYPGADMTVDLLRMCELKSIPAFVIACRNSLSSPEAIKRSCKKLFPKLKIDAEYTSSKVFEQINSTNAGVIFVNFGAPEQEKFIFENRKKFKTAKIIIGVGGSFDFVTGNMKRAPVYIRRLGLEWFWRLYQEPKRIRRIFKAVVIFPITYVLKNK